MSALSWSECFPQDDMKLVPAIKQRLQEIQAQWVFWKKMLQNLQVFLMPKQSSFNPIPWTFEEPQYAFSSTQDTRYQADHKRTIH